MTCKHNQYICINCSIPVMMKWALKSSSVFIVGKLVVIIDILPFVTRIQISAWRDNEIIDILLLLFDVSVSYTAIICLFSNCTGMSQWVRGMQPFSSSSTYARYCCTLYVCSGRGIPYGLSSRVVEPPYLIRWWVMHGWQSINDLNTLHTVKGFISGRHLFVINYL